MIVIDKFGNLVLHVCELRPRQARQHDPQDPQDDEPDKTDDTTRILRSEEFKVCRSTLIERSPVFRALLSPGRSIEGDQNTVTLKDDDIMSMEILLRVLHDLSVETTYKTPITVMWPLVLAVEKYDLDIMDFQKWFEGWYGAANLDRSDISVADTLLYPCYIFQHARAFAYATKVLAYASTGHITERNPTKHYELHLPGRVIQAINAAKGRLRTILHTGLFEPNAQLLGASCKCKEMTLFGYEKTLYDLKVWPLEQMGQRCSVNVLLARLEKFKYKAPELGCRTCRYDYEHNVAKTRARVRFYFDGLCLDCMDKSKPRTGDADQDYWKHNQLSEDGIIRTCRFEHKQPTWYFSFMGRKEDRDRFKRPRKGTSSQAKE